MERAEPWSSRSVVLERLATPWLVAVGLLALAAVYVTPATTCINHGCQYAELAQSPWADHPGNPLRLRWLSPLVAHALGLTGRAYIALPLLALVGFLAGLYTYHRRALGFRPRGALAVTAAMASTMPVVYTLHFAGYSDALSWLLLFAAMVTIELPFVWPLAVGAAVLNHESTLAVFPAMALLAWSRRTSWRTGLAGICLALGVIALAFRARTAMLSVPPSGEVYTAGGYLNEANVRTVLDKTIMLLPLGAFLAFKLVWYVPFAACAVSVTRRRWLDALVILGFVLGPATQLLVAGDTTRLFAAAFPAVLVGARILHAHEGARSFEHRMWRLVLLGLLVPTFFVAWNEIIPFVPAPVTWLLERGLHIDVAKQWWLDCRYGC